MNTIQMFYNTPYFKNLKLTQPFLDYLKREEEKVRSIIRGGKVLDIGCGYGRSTEILSEISDYIIGIDFSERLLKQAEKRLKGKTNVKLYLEDAKSMHFEDSSFDYILMLWNTFGNLYSARDQVLRESIRLLKPDGTIFISVFSENVLAVYLEMLKQNGFTIVNQDEDYVFLKEGLISERFGRVKLRKIFKSLGVKSTIEVLTDISYWCEINNQSIK